MTTSVEPEGGRRTTSTLKDLSSSDFRHLRFTGRSITTKISIALSVGVVVMLAVQVAGVWWVVRQDTVAEVQTGLRGIVASTARQLPWLETALRYTP